MTSSALESPPVALTPSVRSQLAQFVLRAAEAVAGKEAIDALGLRDAGLGVPKMLEHGDYSTPLALALARSMRAAPRSIAEKIVAELGDADGLLHSVSIAGPGHINCTVSAARWQQSLWQALHFGAKTLESNAGANERVLIEFISANPTGPLHVAHGRGAVFGDVVARLMRCAGYAVEREYYVNDLGNQTDVLARSVMAHLQALAGKPFVAPEPYYPGAYVGELAQQLHQDGPPAWLNADEATWLPALRLQATELMLQRIRTDLQAFNVDFDHWVSERELTEAQDLTALVARLRAAGHIFDEDGKAWFRSTDFGDDKDRVVLREDGRPTYFLSDIAYHDEKIKRGYARLINVWGADHGGYIARVKAGLTALGHDANKLEIDLVQMVSLVRAGENVKMGKRLGTAVWLREVIDQAGRDATRYMFLLRRLDAQMEFDLDLATSKSLNNPVFYAQMGHARLCAIGRKAAEQGVQLPAPEAFRLEMLDALQLPEEQALVRSLARGADVVADAARAREPHAVATYLQDLIAQFHSYYGRYRNTSRVISDDAVKTRARLLLCRALQDVLKGLLTLLGVDAPEQMSLEDSDNNA